MPKGRRIASWGHRTRAPSLVLRGISLGLASVVSCGLWQADQRPSAEAGDAPARVVITAGALLDVESRLQGPVRLTVANGVVEHIDRGGAQPEGGGLRHVDLSALTLLPGGIGLHEVAREPAGANGVTPDLVLANQLDFGSQALADAARAGALSVLLEGPPAAIVAGVSSVVRPLDVWSARRLVVPRVGLVLHPHARAVDPKRNVMEAAWEIRRAFLVAQRSAEAGADLPVTTAFRDVLSGTLRAQFRASTLAEFVRAVELSREFDVPVLLTGVTEVPRAALDAARVQVLMAAPTADGFHELWDNYRRLRDAGIPVGILTGALPLPTAMTLSRSHARRLGLTETEVLKAFTLSPATILEATSIGALKMGRSADFVAISGRPFETDSRIERIFIEGREVFDRSRDQ